MTTSISSLSSTQSALQVNGVNSVIFDAGGIVSGIGKNKLINGNPLINQRVVSGTVTLSAGVYGHDRWKSGIGGCTYTFATVLNITTITISAGTLQQVIEGINLQSGTYTLSWGGTAQGRVDSGAYGASGITGTAIGGTNQTVEFGIGTFSLAQYETGGKSSYFEHRSIGFELALCQRYYLGGIMYATTGADASNPGVHGTSAPTFPVAMRAVPTLTNGSVNPYTDGVGLHVNGGANITGVVLIAGSKLNVPFITSVVTGSTAGYHYFGYINASAEL